MSLILEPLFWGVLLCLVITGFVTIVDVAWRAKASIRASTNGSLVPYLFLMVLGNVVATVAGSLGVAAKLPVSLLAWLPVFAAFFGVFAFEGIIMNLNVSIFGKGVLSFPDWLGKARDNAVGSAVEKQVELGYDQIMSRTNYLFEKLTDQQLNTYLVSWCGQETVAETENAAQASGADIKLAKALELATSQPEKTKSLVKQIRKRHR